MHGATTKSLYSVHSTIFYGTAKLHLEGTPHAWKMKAAVQKTDSMRRTRLELFINGNNNNNKPLPNA